MKKTFFVAIAIIVVILVSGISYITSEGYQEKKAKKNWAKMEESQKLIQALPGQWILPEASKYIHYIEFFSDGTGAMVGYGADESKPIQFQWSTKVFDKGVHAFSIGEGWYGIFADVDLKDDMFVMPTNDHAPEFLGTWTRIQ